jgi:hypothetical protein
VKKYGDKRITKVENFSINQINIWYTTLEDINKRIVHRKYEFMDTLDYANLFFFDNSKLGIQIYWKELLQRLHLASITTLMRNFKWIQGIKFGVESNNFIVFASSLRGYFEAFADSFYSTNYKFIDIADNFSNISKALKGILDRPLLSNEFEESLIHFYSASKNANSETYNVEWLDPLTTKKYLDGFDLPGSELKYELYSDLCEIVHPAAPSVKCFTKEEDNIKFSTIRTVPDRDNELIDEILKKYSKLLNLIFRVSNTVPVVNLRMLNYLDEPCINASYIEGSIINNLAVKSEEWKVFVSKIKAE